MVNVLKSFYNLQGKNERIKKFPLPRMYANISRYFIGIFIMLLPFSMIPELQKVGNWGFWISIPVTALIGWIYVMMELVGDYTENPFGGMVNDIPMLSLCRTIEIDLREMLGETDLPENIKISVTRNRKIFKRFVHIGYYRYRFSANYCLGAILITPLAVPCQNTRALPALPAVCNGLLRNPAPI